MVTVIKQKFPFPTCQWEVWWRNGSPAIAERYLPSSLSPLFCALIFPHEAGDWSVCVHGDALPVWVLRSPPAARSSALPSIARPCGVDDPLGREVRPLAWGSASPRRLLLLVETSRGGCSFCWLNASRSIMLLLSGIVLTEEVFVENTVVFWEYLLEFG